MWPFYGDYSLDLKPETYEDQASRELAEIVRDEVEKERTRRGGNRQFSEGKSAGLLGQRGDGKICIADVTPWFEILTSFDVMEGVAKRLNATLVPTLTAVVEVLRPPNWQTFFWMKAFLERLENTVSTGEVTRLVQLQMAAKAKQAAKIAGRASGRKRKLEAVDPAAVLAEAARQMAAGVKAHKIASSLAAGFHVTPDRIRQILRDQK